MGGYLIRPDNTPVRARFPEVDLHNHLWTRWESLDGVVQIMDQTGVAVYCDLTGVGGVAL